MERLFDAFLRLRLKHGLAIIFAHHDRKPSAGSRGKSIYDSRGNSVITDRPDTSLRLKAVKGGLSVDAVWEKLRNGEGLPPTQRWIGDRKTGLFRPNTPGDAPEDKGDTVTALLRDAGRGLPLVDLAKSVAQASGVSVKVAYGMIDALERAAVVQKSPGPGGHNQKVVTLT